MVINFSVVPVQRKIYWQETV